MNTIKYMYTLYSLLLLLASCSDEDTTGYTVPEQIPATLTIQPDIEYQKVQGFGVMETSWQQTALTEEEMNTLFGTGADQLGCNILRIRIAPKDKNQTADSRWGTVARVAKVAKDLGTTILATPWTPPVSLKTIDNIVDGELADYAGYAEYLKEFLTYMKQQGAAVDVVSIQNEPDFEVTYESCRWTGLQQAKFFKQYGASIKAAHPDVKLMTGESFQYRHESTDPILEDEQACAVIDVVGGHIYGGGNTPYDLAKAKGKEYWMTEHLLNEVWEKKAPYLLIGDVRAETLQLAAEINTAMASGFNAYIYWYGRRYYGMLGDGLANSTMSAITPRGYMYTQFAKNLTGKTRVKVVASKNVSASVDCTAYKDSQGNLTLMFVNRTSSDIKGLNLALPFIPAEVKMTVSTVPTESFPETNKGMLVESAISSLENGLDIKAYSIVTVNIKR